MEWKSEASAEVDKMIDREQRERRGQVCIICRKIPNLKQGTVLCSTAQQLCLIFATLESYHPAQ